MKNVLEYSKILEGAGLTRAQAEAHLKVMEQAMEEGMATKRDVTDLKGELKSEISLVKADVAVLKMDVSVLKEDVSELKADVSVLKKDVSELKVDVAGLKSDFQVLEYKIVTKLGVIVTVAMTGLATFFKFFI